MRRVREIGTIHFLYLPYKLPAGKLSGYIYLLKSVINGSASTFVIWKTIKRLLLSIFTGRYTAFTVKIELRYMAAGKKPLQTAFSQGKLSGPDLEENN